MATAMVRISSTEPRLAYYQTIYLKNMLNLKLILFIHSCILSIYLGVFDLLSVCFVYLHTTVADCRIHWGYQSALWGFQGISVGLWAAPYYEEQQMAPVFQIT